MFCREQGEFLASIILYPLVQSDGATEEIIFDEGIVEFAGDESAPFKFFVFEDRADAVRQYQHYRQIDPLYLIILSAASTHG